MAKKQDSKLELFGMVFEKSGGNIFLKFAKPVVLGRY
jgi:hypothetical protein